MRTLHDRYKTVGCRDFASAVEYMLETEFKLVGSHRVIRMIVESIMELHREFFPETKQQMPGTILWATTKSGDGAKVGWGKRAESYGIQMVQLPLVTKAEIESRMNGGRGRDPKDNRKKQFRRETATLVRLVKSAAEQGGLLTGAELSLLMNRSLMKIHEYVRTHEEETGEALPLKGYVLDMGSSPTHKGIICRKFEEGMSPPDIARATGHNLDSVDNYLGTYRRIKVLLRKGFDVETICQVTGKAPRTVAEYLVIAEHYHPELVGKDHRDWLMKRRKKLGTVRFLPAETMTTMVTALEKGGSKESGQVEIVAPGGSGEADSTCRTTSRGRSRTKKAPKQRSKK
ncbi:MAG: DUF1670 domain-containing protein [Candidatus Eisenbacteria bacterium]